MEAAAWAPRRWPSFSPVQWGNFRSSWMTQALNITLFLSPPLLFQPLPGQSSSFQRPPCDGHKMSLEGGSSVWGALVPQSIKGQEAEKPRSACLWAEPTRVCIRRGKSTLSQFPPTPASSSNLPCLLSAQRVSCPYTVENKSVPESS